MNAVAGQTHGMIAGLKIGSAIFKNANVAAGIFQAEMDHGIRVADKIARFRRNEYGGARVRGKSEE